MNTAAVEIHTTTLYINMKKISNTLLSEKNKGQNVSSFQN